MKERKITSEAEARRFFVEKAKKLKEQIGKNKAICFVSGGVDSSVVALMSWSALGRKNFLPIIVENGLMREAEVASVRSLFSSIGILLQSIDASELFFESLKGKICPYDKRAAIRTTFYEKVLPEAIKQFGVKFFLQGTTLTDIEATVKDSKAPQHNVLKQIGLSVGRDVEIIEPLAELRKPSIRIIAKAMGLPKDIWNRMPFPGPALAARIVGEVTRKKVEIIRKVTAFVEKELFWTSAFQYFPVLASDMVPNHNRTKLGYAIVIECIKSNDATSAVPELYGERFIENIRDKIYCLFPEVFKVAWDFSTKPPAAVEWV